MPCAPTKLIMNALIVLCFVSSIPLTMAGNCRCLGRPGPIHIGGQTTPGEPTPTPDEPTTTPDEPTTTPDEPTTTTDEPTTTTDEPTTTTDEQTTTTDEPTTTPSGPVTPTGPICPEISCTDFLPCFVELGINGNCISGKCKCNLGFHYDSSCTCVQECDTYGDTYIEYPGISLACPTADNSEGFPVPVDQCEALCNADPTCISYNYVNVSGDVCLVQPCDSGLTVGGSDAILYVRNCAIEER